MNGQVAKSQMTYDIIDASEMSHYMTLEEMHERLTANIRKSFAK